MNFLLIMTVNQNIFIKNRINHYDKNDNKKMAISSY